MKPTGVLHIWILFFLPLVLGTKSDNAPGLATILILLFILLLLLILLFFSWHKLNTATDGHYHPRNLWQMGTQGGGTMAGEIAGRWQAVWARVTGESSDQLSQSEDDPHPEFTGARRHKDPEDQSEASEDTLGPAENEETDEDDYYGTEYINPASMQATEKADIPTTPMLSNNPTEDTSETLLSTETEASRDASASSFEALTSGHRVLSGSEVIECSSLEGSVSIHISAL